MRSDGAVRHIPYGISVPGKIVEVRLRELGKTESVTVRLAKSCFLDGRRTILTEGLETIRPLVKQSISFNRNFKNKIAYPGSGVIPILAYMGRLNSREVPLAFSGFIMYI